jgi:hypothetical protein
MAAASRRRSDAGRRGRGGGLRRAGLWQRAACGARGAAAVGCRCRSRRRRCGLLPAVCNGLLGRGGYAEPRSCNDYWAITWAKLRSSVRNGPTGRCILAKQRHGSRTAQPAVASRPSSAMAVVTAKTAVTHSFSRNQYGKGPCKGPFGR